MYYRFLPTPVGTLQIVASDQALQRIIFPDSTQGISQTASVPKDHQMLSNASRQLAEYFNGSRRQFVLNMAPEGTLFQHAVWEQMQQIPYGETCTYGEIAARLGNLNKARAVGNAANKNPLPIVIPCHRVIGGSGSLTGFAGGLETKQFLLNLEKRF